MIQSIFEYSNTWVDTDMAYDVKSNVAVTKLASAFSFELARKLAIFGCCNLSEKVIAAFLISFSFFKPSK